MRNIAHRLSEVQVARSRKALKFLGPDDFAGLHKQGWWM